MVKVNFLIIVLTWLIASAQAAEKNGETTPTASRVRIQTLIPDQYGLLSCEELYDVADIFIDQSKKVTIADVSRKEFTSRFTPNQARTQPLAPGDATVWVRIRLQSILPQEHTWWLEVGAWSIVELYFPENEGFSMTKTGTFVPLPDRGTSEVMPTSYTVPIHLPSGPKETTFYLRLSSKGGNPGQLEQLMLHGILHQEMARWSRSELFFATITFGTLLALGLYHLILFLRVPEKVYLFFGLALLGRGLLLIGSNHILFELFWPSQPRFDYYFSLWVYVLWVIPFYLFLMSFLNTIKRAPRTHLFLVIIMLTSILYPLQGLLHDRFIAYISQGLLATWAIVPIAVAACFWRTMEKEAFIFLAANVLMLAHLIAQALSSFSIDVPLIFTRWGWHFGMLLAAILFSIAVAERIRDLQQERDLAQENEIKISEQLRRGELEATHLIAELSAAQLQFLRNQLQPHFLFNTLNTVAGLMQDDVNLAERTLSQLTELLRIALQDDRSNEVRLEEEIAFVTRYLEIEKIRFPQRLEIVWDIAPDTRQALVPHLILQPLVENSVRHGIAPRSKLGTILLRSTRREDILEIVVKDNGVGPNNRAQPREGVGLANARARLNNLYGQSATFVTGEATGGGFEVRFSLPFHTQPISEKSGPTE